MMDVDAIAAARQRVRAWAKDLMKNRVADKDKFLFDKILHAAVVDPRTGYFKSEQSLGGLGQVRLKQTVKSFERLRQAGVIRCVDAGSLLVVYIPRKLEIDGGK